MGAGPFFIFPTLPQPLTHLPTGRRSLLLFVIPLYFYPFHPFHPFQLVESCSCRHLHLRNGHGHRRHHGDIKDTCATKYSHQEDTHYRSPYGSRTFRGVIPAVRRVQLIGLNVLRRDVLPGLTMQQQRHVLNLCLHPRFILIFIHKKYSGHSATTEWTAGTFLTVLSGGAECFFLPAILFLSQWYTISFNGFGNFSFFLSSLFPTSQTLLPSPSFVLSLSIPFPHSNSAITSLTRSQSTLQLAANKEHKCHSTGLSCDP